LPSYGEPCCEHHNIWAISDEELTEVEEALIKAIRNGTAGEFDAKYFQFLKDNYIKALNDGYFDRINSTSLNAPDHTVKAFMEMNIAHFSSAKTMAMVQELNQALSESTGFSDFKKRTEPILNTYNRNYLRTEYNLAVATAQNAARYYNQMESVAEVPYLIYRTANDGRVRSAHQALQGMVFKKTDMASASIYPPNGYGCRCEMIESFDVPRGSKLSSTSLAEQSLRNTVDKQGVSEYERMVKGGFNVNKGVVSEVFARNQFYVKKNFDQNFSVEANGLKPYAKLKQNSLNDYISTRTNEQQAKQWFSERVGVNDLNDANNIRLTDFSRKPIALSKADFEKQLTAKNAPLVDAMEQALRTPDEVFLLNNNTVRYIKYYKGKAIEVTVNVDKNGKLLSVDNWRELTENIDQQREGVLLHQSGKTKK
jgi:SPP1 gp7 family putative phage head morphogenesis protein